MSEENNIEGAINAATGLLKEVPIYQDALQPAAKELGVALLTVTKTINVALAPISALVWGYEQIKEFLATRLAQKLKEVPEEKIVTPDATVAGPTLEALKYAGHKTELAEMYASLLATAMNVDTKNNAHPSFVEIIKQLRGDEAIILKNVLRVHQLPIFQIQVSIDANQARGYHVVLNHLIDLTDSETGVPQVNSHLPMMVQNWIRLGLVEVSYEKRLTSADRYTWVEGRPEVVSLKETHEKNGVFINCQPGMLNITDFGLQFYMSVAMSG